MVNDEGTNLRPLGHYHSQLTIAMNVAQHKTVNSLKTLKNTVVVVDSNARQAQTLEVTLWSRDAKWLDNLVQYKQSDGFCVSMEQVHAKLESKSHSVYGLNPSPVSPQANPEHLIL